VSSEHASSLALATLLTIAFTLSPFISPARKVREVYVRVYNSNYMGAQDALVPYFPSMEEFSDERNDYKRHELYALL
jgi:splicing factor 3B subunit 1